MAIGQSPILSAQKLDKPRLIWHKNFLIPQSLSVIWYVYGDFRTRLSKNLTSPERIALSQQLSQPVISSKTGVTLSNPTHS